VVVLNAGIGERGDFLDSTPESDTWQKTLDVDLRAVLVGMRAAAQAMRGLGRGGRILSVASAAGARGRGRE
jgi:NAD(P)-dependent dehydrogenase (short-subunit alcohol dehydrogenase family)